MRNYKIEKVDNGFIVRTTWPFTVVFMDKGDNFIYDVQPFVGNYRLCSVFTRSVNGKLSEEDIKRMLNDANLTISESKCEFIFGYSSLHSYVVNQIPDVNRDDNSRTFRLWYDGNIHKLVQTDYDNFVLYSSNAEINLKLNGKFKHLLIPDVNFTEIYSASLSQKLTWIDNQVNLNVLINDPDPMIRMIMADHGYGLDKLINDPDQMVAKMAKARQ